jgi:DNA-directed RNA polymerase subunit K/omega
MYKHIDCRYTGVVIAARRARQLMSEDPTNAAGKPLLRAFDDLMKGRLKYRFVDPHALYEEEYYGEYSFSPDEEEPAEKDEPK